MEPYGNKNIDTMTKKPVLTIHLNSIDKAIEYAGWLLLIAIWVYAIIHYAELPDQIPVHFNAQGEPDAYGGKQYYFVTLIISSVIFIGLTILNKYPHLFNYMKKITQENALKHYTTATRMIRMLKLILILVFGTVTYMQTMDDGYNTSLSAWFMPIMLVCLFGPLVYFIMRMMQKR